MTPEERADILARHRPHEQDQRFVHTTYCSRCAQPWGEHGCDAYRLGHDVDEEALARAIRRMLDLQDWPDDGYWRDAAYRQRDGAPFIAAALAAAYREQVR